MTSIWSVMREAREFRQQVNAEGKRLYSASWDALAVAGILMNAVGIYMVLQP